MAERKDDEIAGEVAISQMGVATNAICSILINSYGFG